MLVSQSMIPGSIIKSWNELMGNQDGQHYKHFSGELLKSYLGEINRVFLQIIHK
jgi:hypothetical protein